MSLILGTETVGSEALRQMRAAFPGEPDVRWAAYQSMDMSSPDLGALRFLAVGGKRTFRQAPPRYPDTAYGLGWRYTLVGWVDLDDGTIAP